MTPTDRSLQELRRMARSLWISHAVYAAAQLSIADALSSAPETAEAVAKSVGAHPESVRRLMRALVTLGILKQTANDEFELSETGSLLRSDAPDSLRNWVLFGGPRRSRHWSQFTECIRTGETAATLLGDATPWPFGLFAEQTDEWSLFSKAMAETSGHVDDSIVMAYEFGDVKRVVDVGGGYGVLIGAILRTYSSVTGTVFDLPWCRTGAEETLGGKLLAGRGKFVAGNFLEDALPEGADLYVLKRVLHDWEDRQCLTILQKCRDAAPRGSRLLIVEGIVPERLEASLDHQHLMSADLNMLIMTGGRERTHREYEKLLQQTSYDVSRVISTSSSLSIIEAQAV